MPINLALPPGPKFDKSLLPYLSNLAARIQGSFQQGLIAAPTAKVYRNPGQGFFHSGLTPVTWTHVLWDSSSFWNPADPTKLTAPESGVYIASSHLRAGPNLGTGYYWISRFHHNGAIVDETLWPGNVTGYCEGNIITKIRMNKGDYLQVLVVHNYNIATQGFDMGTVPTFALTRLADG